MLEKFIKKDRNEELERILEEKNVEEHAKNLLQGILYKIEVSYKDYKNATQTETTEEKYIEELLKNIEKKCDKIMTINLRDKIEDEEIQKELEEKKYYIANNEIICYPIEKKILYAIEKQSNTKRIVNNKYGIITIPLSNLINTGKNIDRIEVLRDFNGWSWATIKNELENIKANLVYQTLKILLGEEFLNSWTIDTDGIIDYVQFLKEELTQKFGEEISKEIYNQLSKIALINSVEEDIEAKDNILEQLKKLEKESEIFKNTKENITKITEYKKEISKEIKDIETILSQESKLKEEYERRNKDVPIHQKIFSIKVLKQQLNEKKQRLLNEIEEKNYMLNPVNYLNEKEKIEKQKEMLETIKYTEKQKEQLIIEFEKSFLQCFKILVEKENEQEEITKLVYKLRYFMLLPFDLKRNIKDVEELNDIIEEIEKKLTKLAINKKVIVNLPTEVMSHVFKTRIIKLEELYFEIIKEAEKYYVQIFDENVSEDKLEIRPTEKMKINKKTKIFI